MGITAKEGEVIDCLARGESVPGAQGACARPGCGHGYPWHTPKTRDHPCERCGCRGLVRQPSAPTWARVEDEHPRWEIKNPNGDGRDYLLTDEAIRTFGRKHMTELMHDLPPLPEEAWRADWRGEFPMMIRETTCVEHQHSGPEHDMCTHPEPVTEAEPSARIRDLPQRFPGMTQAEAARLVAEVESNGHATYTHGGRTWTLRPSTIPGSRAIWAKPADPEPSLEELEADPEVMAQANRILAGEGGTILGIPFGPRVPETSSPHGPFTVAGEAELREQFPAMDRETAQRLVDEADDGYAPGAPGTLGVFLREERDPFTGALISGQRWKVTRQDDGTYLVTVTDEAGERS